MTRRLKSVLLPALLAAVLVQAAVPARPSPALLARLHQLFPAVRTVALLYTDPGSEAAAQQAQAEAAKLGLTLTPVRIAKFEAIPPTVRSLFGKIDALWLADDPMLVQPDALNYTLLNAAQQRWITVVPREEALRRGGLLYLEPDGAAVVNAGVLKLLKLTLPENAGPVRFFGETQP